MENLIGSNGIQIQTLPEIVADITDGNANTPGLKQIYGADINVDQNSPDGQMVNIFALSKQDVLDLIVQDYNAKDPDQAVGVALDGVCQLCGISRNGGTYTHTQIVVTTDRNLTLNGQDTSTPFTVSDTTGNLFQLITSTACTTGANTLDFIAVDIGAIQVSTNTITTATTVILGVVSVNNPYAPTISGVDQETDAQLRLRRQASIAMPAQGCLAGLLGGLLALTGVIEAVVYENTTNSVDAFSIPAHGIWVIVNGGATVDVAETIYKYRPIGVPMSGTTTSAITQIDGSTATMAFDRAVAETLSIQMSLTSKSGGSIDTDALKAGMVAGSTYGIYETADITSVTNLVHSINPDLIVYNAGVKGAGASYVNSTNPASLKNYFTLATTGISIV